MTQQYLAGELSVHLAELQAATRNQAFACEIACLRQQAENAPITALAQVAQRALELSEVLCWDSLICGDAAAFSRQAAIGARVREFGICSCLLAEPSDDFLLHTRE